MNFIYFQLHPFLSFDKLWDFELEEVFKVRRLWHGNKKVCHYWHTQIKKSENSFSAFSGLCTASFTAATHSTQILMVKNTLDLVTPVLYKHSLLN